ncbi:alpha/beta hydrolase [Lactobacillus equicursoris]|uniref:alpha/beta hydrolase n=1 Tax=Lactobacillus equicursoris TaxID=420645 RepID=UPI00242A44F8|nr:alpha/beta hydrolase [Lactobacillus equicursoris]MDD6386124.1 alpha/beta hydrolase [Lactobacillus equicursoris]
MLSEQAKQAIEFSRKYIKSGQAPQTPEIALAARKGADEGNKYDLPEEVTLKAVDEGGVKGEFYLRADSPKAVLMFLHGGAYATGTVYSRRKVAIKLGQAIGSGIDVFAVDYTQYPEGRHPAAQEDIMRAYDYLRGLYDQVLVFGESAGATLALTLTLQLKDEGKKLPERVSVFSPVINQLNTSASEYLRTERDPMLVGATAPVPYFDEPAKIDPLISPIYGDFTGFPPLFINCGSEEVKYDSSAILNNLCEKAGVDVQWHVWQDLFHVFILFDMPETDLAVKQIGEFFKAGVKFD